MKVAVGSKNPVKVKATENVMERIYSKAKVISIKVDSGVSHTPLSEETAIKGAINRAKKAIKRTKGDLGVGMEGGVAKKFGRYFLQGWCAVVDKKGEVILGGCDRLELPHFIIKKVLSGAELGDVMDKVTGKHNTKRKMGAVGIFTRGLTNRQEAWEQALIYAMSKKLKPELYK